jgi:hypothetical protein
MRFDTSVGSFGEYSPARISVQRIAHRKSIPALSCGSIVCGNRIIMRSKIFRSLAGIVAALCAVVLYLQKPAFPVLVKELAIFILFSVYAVFGDSAADRVLSALGYRPDSPKNPDNEQKTN